MHNRPLLLNDFIISIGHMAHEPNSTARTRRLRERRERGMVPVAPVELGEGGVPLPVGSAESVCRDSLDRFIAALADLAERERGVDAEFFPVAPRHTPRHRRGEAAK